MIYVEIYFRDHLFIQKSIGCVLFFGNSFFIAINIKINVCFQLFWQLKVQIWMLRQRLDTPPCMWLATLDLLAWSGSCLNAKSRLMFRSVKLGCFVEYNQMLLSHYRLPLRFRDLWCQMREGQTLITHRKKVTGNYTDLLSQHLFL